MVSTGGERQELVAFLQLYALIVPLGTIQSVNSNLKGLLGGQVGGVVSGSGLGLSPVNSDDFVYQIVILGGDVDVRMILCKVFIQELVQLSKLGSLGVIFQNSSIVGLRGIYTAGVVAEDYQVGRQLLTGSGLCCGMEIPRPALTSGSSG